MELHFLKLKFQRNLSSVQALEINLSSSGPLNNDLSSFCVVTNTQLILKSLALHV